MSEQSFVNIINEHLAGDSQKNALGFIAFCAANEIRLAFNDKDNNGGDFGNHTGTIWINDDTDNSNRPYVIFFNYRDFGDENLVDNELKESVWANVNFCLRCHPGWETCGGGNNVIFFGKTFKNTCNSPLAFTNPNISDLKNIKKLLLITNKK